MTKFNSFFNKSERAKIEGETYNMSDIVKLVFDDIFVKFNSKCYNQLMHYTDNPVLNMLFSDTPIDKKEKADKTSDDIFFTFFFPGEDRIFSDSNSEDSASSRQRQTEETVMEVTTPPIV